MRNVLDAIREFQDCLSFLNVDYTEVSITLPKDLWVRFMADAKESCYLTTEGFVSPVKFCGMTIKCEDRFTRPEPEYKDRVDAKGALLSAYYDACFGGDEESDNKSISECLYNTYLMERD